MSQDRMGTYAYPHLVSLENKLYHTLNESPKRKTASQAVLVVKNLPANAGTSGGHRFDPRVGKVPRRRKWQPAPVFLLG